MNKKENDKMRVNEENGPKLINRTRISDEQNMEKQSNGKPREKVYRKKRLAKKV